VADFACVTIYFDSELKDPKDADSMISDKFLGLMLAIAYSGPSAILFNGFTYF